MSAFGKGREGNSINVIPKNVMFFQLQRTLYSQGEQRNCTQYTLQKILRNIPMH